MEVEAFPIRFTRGIRSYWGRRKYQRLEAADGGGSRIRATRQLGGARRGSGGGWGVRLRRLLRVRVRVAAVLRSPARVLARVRDAYVGGMLAVSRKASGLTLPGGGGEAMLGKRVPRRKQLAAPRDGQQPTEFEQRLILEIYKSIVSSKELTTMLHSSTAHLPTPTSTNQSA